MAAEGFRYFASQQSDADTLRRLNTGTAFVAEDAAGRISGTVTVYPHSPESVCAWYRLPGHFHFGQFAVLPGL